MKIIVQHDDGTEQDVTSLVQIAYDVSTHSMDWGSGFLDQEEVDGLILLAAACRFPDTDAIDEAWRKHFQVTHELGWGELRIEAESRGVHTWSLAKPTEVERSAFLADLMREYTPR